MKAEKQIRYNRHAICMIAVLLPSSILVTIVTVVSIQQDYRFIVDLKRNFSNVCGFNLVGVALIVIGVFGFVQCCRTGYDTSSILLGCKPAFVTKCLTSAHLEHTGSIS